MTTLPVNRLDGSGLTRRIFVDDLNTAIIIRLFDLSSGTFDPLVDPTPPPLDISAQTALTMRFSKPGDEPGDAPVIVNKPATFATITALPGFAGDGTDGYMEYKTESGFLDRSGRWRREGFVTIPAGSFASEIIDFEVLDHL